MAAGSRMTVSPDYRWTGLAVRLTNPHPGHVSLHCTLLATAPAFIQHLA